MKSIRELKNPDMVLINGKRFQVTGHIDGLCDSEEDNLEMVVELVKVGEKTISPNYYLSYMSKKPQEIKFSIYNNKTKESKEQKILSINF